MKYTMEYWQLEIENKEKKAENKISLLWINLDLLKLALTAFNGSILRFIKITSGCYTDNGGSLNLVTRPETELRGNKPTFTNEEVVLLE